MRMSDWSSVVCSSDLPRVRPQPQAQRHVVAEQRLPEDLRRPWRSPGVGVAGRDHAGVGEAGLHRRLVLPVDDDDLMSVAGQFVGGDRKSTTSELQSLMRISYAVFCLKKKNT